MGKRFVEGVVMLENSGRIVLMEMVKTNIGAVEHVQNVDWTAALGVFKGETMSEFRKEFPSLKEFYIDCRDIAVDPTRKAIIEEVIKRIEIRVAEEVRKHCLDKQKVKEAKERLISQIEEAEPSFLDEDSIIDIIKEIFDKELGLE